MKKRIPWETEAGMGNDRRSHIHRMHGGQEGASRPIWAFQISRSGDCRLKENIRKWLCVVMNERV